MDPKDSQNNDSQRPGLNRRHFIAALGATAASAAFLRQFARADDGTVQYLDSFGNVVAASPEALAMGVYPPPIPGSGFPDSPQDARHSRRSHLADADPPPSGGYKPPNFLMIMVDQLRSPRWLPSVGGQAAVDGLLSNIAYLRTHSISFTNYFVAATSCTPSRATLLTGLYTQQNCMFQTQDSTTCEPSLQTTYLNIATVLNEARNPGYNCYWVGKWHLSDPTGSGDPSDGGDGPSDYGFITSAFNPPTFPPSSSYASPNGVGNLGTEGYNPAGAPGGATRVPNTSVPTIDFYNDAAIADWFVKNTIPLLNTNSPPWFAAVSFVNPHDITGFPFSYLLAPTSGVFGTALGHPNQCYYAPNTGGEIGSGYDASLPPLNSLYSSSSQPPLNWNVLDNPVSQPYNGGYGKPGLQLAFQGHLDNQDGQVLGFIATGGSTTTGWTDFLNYYLWMQQCVDYQIGNVLSNFKLSVGSAAQNNTIILFLSDHGDYGGSHWMHAKSGALYDESINVPLYISFPPMRGTDTGNIVSGANPYVCSSVDILPFLYGMALGNDYNWRYNTATPIYYLAGRESIMDAIYSSTPYQRRLSTVPNNSGNYHGQSTQPYILHTTDEFSSAEIPNGSSDVSVPSHAIGFRTVDLTVTQLNPDGVNVQGGGKLGIYSYWRPLNSSHPTQPNLNPGQQFEFYDYTGGNLGEVGNQWATESAQATAFQSAFNAAVPNELYYIDSRIATSYNAALNSYIVSQMNVSCMASTPSLDI